MRKFRFFGIAVLVLSMLFAVIGCKKDPDPPASMKFKMDDNSAEFTIDENFEFNVKFLVDGGFGGIISAGETVSGKIKNASPNTWNSTFQGIAYSMSSDNSLVDFGVSTMEIKIQLIYTGNTLVVNFPDMTMDPSDPNTQAYGLMGGSYTKQP